MSKAPLVQLRGLAMSYPEGETVRVVFRFNNRSFGRLRRMIDFLNL